MTVSQWIRLKVHLPSRSTSKWHRLHGGVDALSPGLFVNSSETCCEGTRLAQAVASKERALAEPPCIGSEAEDRRCRVITDGRNWTGRSVSFPVLQLAWSSTLVDHQ